MGLGGPKESCIRWVSDPDAKGQLLGEITCRSMPGGRRHSAVSCAKVAEPIDFPFRLWIRIGRRKHKSIVFVARWRQCALMANTIESSVCNGDAALWQNTLTTCDNNYRGIKCLLLRSKLTTYESGVVRPSYKRLKLGDIRSLGNFPQKVPE